MLKARCLTTAVVLVALPLLGQSIVVDAGGPGDSGYSSPPGYTTTAYTITAPIPLPITPPGTNDLTLRYGQSFTYSVTVPQPGPYIVLLNFIEPTVQAAGLRIFSVWANDQPIVQNIDLSAEAGYLVPTARASVVAVAGTSLNLTFLASVRNAVISAITVSPITAASVSGSSIVLPPACAIGDMLWVVSSATNTGAFVAMCNPANTWSQPPLPGPAQCSLGTILNVIDSNVSNAGPYTYPCLASGSWM